MVCVAALFFLQPQHEFFKELYASDALLRFYKYVKHRLENIENVINLCRDCQGSLNLSVAVCKQHSKQ